MQRFVDNWSTTLQAPLFAADLEMGLPSDMAAKLLLDPGDFYDLTIDPLGSAPEIVRATAVAGGVVTLSERGVGDNPAPVSWPAGTVVRCSITAGFLHAVQVPAGGDAARSLVLIELGALSVPADAGLLVSSGYATDSSQVTLPVPADGKVLTMDLQLAVTAESPGDPAYELELILPGGDIGAVEVPTATAVVSSETLTLSNITTRTFCRLFISTGGGVPQLDLVTYSPAAPTP